VLFESMTMAPVARILLIDDDPTLAELLDIGLSEQGYEIAGALTSDDGLKSITTSRPDLVLLDIGLPHTNGVEVLKQIRSVDPTIRVIMVTANRDLRLAREALLMGALAYVDKPFDLAYLGRVVAMALRSETKRPDDLTETDLS